MRVVHLLMVQVFRLVRHRTIDGTAGQSVIYSRDAR